MDELRAFLFGATIAAAIGPIALLIIHTGARHGLRPALASAAGVAVADFAYALVAFAAGSGIASMLQREQRTFALVAGAILVAIGTWFAMDAVRDAANATREADTRRIGFAETFLLTLANPLTIVLFAGFSGQLALSSRWTEALYFALFIFAGSLPVQAGYALFGAFLHRLAPGSATMTALNIVSAIGIVLFGAYGIARAV